MDSQDRNSSNGALPGRRCPYCGAHQFAVQDEAELFRCHGCNLFVRGSWLVDDPLDVALNDDRRWLCPWCGYPAGQMQTVLPDNAEFLCGGCSGTLIGDMLVTQSDVDIERKGSRRTRTSLMILLALVLAFVVVVFMVLS